MEKLIHDTFSLFATMIVVALLLCTAITHKAYAWLWWLIASGGMTLVACTLYVLFDLELRLKVRFIAPSVARTLLAAANISDYVSTVFTVMGFAGLTLWLRRTGDSHG